MRATLRGGLAAVLAATLLLSGCAASEQASVPPPPAAEPTATASASAEPAPVTPPVTPPVAADPVAAVAVGVEPARLSVPAMELDVPLIPLGIQADGAMEVPVDYDDVGWFSGGGRPGGVGPTVIAAHVDSRSGPAVFFRLGELLVGDEFEITGVDSSVHRYRVSAVESHAKAAFPTARVFGATLADEVRLITCGGEYDTSIGRYTDNVVVFASRI